MVRRNARRVDHVPPLLSIAPLRRLCLCPLHEHLASAPRQALVHIALIIAALVLLRVLPGASWQPHGEEDPTLRILWMLALTIGLPYFVLSATGPLLQAWFAHSFPGRSPYRLFALSNAGSLLALLSYPFLFERLFDLPHQAAIWATGFIAFALLCGYAAYRLRTSSPSPCGRGQGEGALESSPNENPRVAGVEPQASPQRIEPNAFQKSRNGRPQPLNYLFWLILPAFASVALMATTNHVSTDVAVVPLLWVVPLALYLLTFILAFDRPVWYHRTLIAVLTIVAIYGTGLFYKTNIGAVRLYDCGMTGICAQTIAEIFHLANLGPDGKAISPEAHFGFRTALATNFIAMFGICYLCHGELARLKPHPRHLTAYYLLIAGGGALGGLAVSIVAPHVFDTVFEWNLTIFTAAVLSIGIILYVLVNCAMPGDCPDFAESAEQNGTVPIAQTSKTSPFGRGQVSEGDTPWRGEGRLPAQSSRRSTLVPRILLILLLLPMALVLLDLTDYLFAAKKNVVYQSRNFFGTLTIRRQDSDNPHIENLVLLNGTTIHGSQFTAPDRRGLPTSYYAPVSGIGRVLKFFRNYRPPGGMRVADVGLGTGTLAAYVTKGDYLTFYEINPAVIDMSTSGKWFTYVADCRSRGAHCDIKLGDARLTLQREVQQNSPLRAASGAGEGPPPPSAFNSEQPAKKFLPRYNVLVLDAFSGDAVPTHLLTIEAYKIYLARLATENVDGADGALVVHVSNRYLDLARVVRAAAQEINFPYIEIHSPSVDDQLINAADWMILTRNKALLTELKPAAYIPDHPPKPPVLWTDSRSSLFEIVR